ncbi:MAG: hypothetical protein LiPW15_307 [Parcubacteria group bacterium LiPW_15]|nr:MAG: hypothetical protein LiPW15_307 [Parcubacteria group bacterium LiPW_15]
MSKERTIIVISGEELPEEKRKEILESLPKRYEGRKPKVRLVPSDLSPAAAMYVVQVEAKYLERWLRVYRKRERKLVIFAVPDLQTTAQVRFKNRIRFKN